MEEELELGRSTGDDDQPASHQGAMLGTGDDAEEIRLGKAALAEYAQVADQVAAAVSADDAAGAAARAAQAAYAAKEEELASLLAMASTDEDDNGDDDDDGGDGDVSLSPSAHSSASTVAGQQTWPLGGCPGTQSNAVSIHSTTSSTSLESGRLEGELHEHNFRARQECAGQGRQIKPGPIRIGGSVFGRQNSQLPSQQRRSLVAEFCQYVKRRCFDQCRSSSGGGTGGEYARHITGSP